MKKGIIMEIEDGFLTLLTPEGEFLRARKQSQPYSIGEEIYFFPMESVNGSMSKRSITNIFRIKTVWIAMAVLMVFIGTFIPMYQDDKAYAYMSIDANPSVEMGVNKKMQVVKLNGFNKEGKDIISRLEHWKNEDVTELTKVIFAEMKKGGYLKENTQVLISTVRIEQPEEKVEEKLQRKLDKIEASVNKEKVELIVLTGNKKGLKEAHKQGISNGKYQLSQEKSKQQNMEQIGKEKEKEKTTVPAQTPSVNPMSPGQSKKQNDTQSGWDKGDEKGNWDRNANSPGYLKKMEEENSKQNQGEYRKQSDSNWKNNGHNNSNHSNNYRQNNNNSNYRQNNNSSHNSNNHGNDERNNNRHDNDNNENGNNNNRKNN